MPVGAAVPDTVVVIGGAVVGLLSEKLTEGIDDEAAIKIMEDDTVMLVALWLEWCFWVCVFRW